MRRFFKKLDRLFVGIVLIPTILAAVYYFGFASDVYVSESRFVVRSPEKPAQSTLGVLLKGAGFTNAGEELYAVRDFIVSRDALRQANHDDYVRKSFSNPEASIFDRFNRFGGEWSREKLYKYYQKKVGVDYDASSSILRLYVRSFDPRTPQTINLRLLNLSERLVNQLNQRGRRDLIRSSTNEVVEAKAQAQAAGRALASYRNRLGVVDPEKQATVQLQMVSKLQDELIATRTQLRQLEAFTPQNPQIPSLRLRINQLQKEIQRALGAVSGSQRSLAANTAEYQSLVLESQIADRQLAAAMAAQSDAVNEARRKQAYVERIVEPNLPDYPLEPRRLRGVLAVAVLTLVIWLIARMLLAGVREHHG